MKYKDEIDKCFKEKDNSPSELKSLFSEKLKGKLADLSKRKLGYLPEGVLGTLSEYPDNDKYLSVVGYFLNKKEDRTKFRINTSLSFVAIIIALLSTL